MQIPPPLLLPFYQTHLYVVAGSPCIHALLLRTHAASASVAAASSRCSWQPDAIATAVTELGSAHERLLLESCAHTCVMLRFDRMANDASDGA